MNIDEKRLVQTFMDLIRISSPSRQEGRLAEHVAGRLRGLGFEVRIDDAGHKIGGETGNVWGRWPASGGASGGPVLLCAHMDTVRPTEGLEPEIKGGVVRSDGRHILGADDKGGLSAILEGLTVVNGSKKPHPEVHVLFTVAEELGLFGAKGADDDELRAARLGVVFDSGSRVGTIVVDTPSEYDLRVTVTGKAAHAGVEPEKGINAIHVAAKAIAALPTGRIDEFTTMNFGVIEGGTATNIVPAETTVELEVRSRDRAALESLVGRVEATFRREAEAAKARVNIDKRLDFEAFKLGPDDEVVRTATAALKRLGLRAELVSRGGGSDANVFNARGLPTVNVGVGPNEEHTNRENVAVDQLVKAAELVVALIDVVGEGSS